MYKNCEISTKPSVYMEGRPCPCCYDFKWSEITARGDLGPASYWYDLKSSIMFAKEKNIVDMTYLKKLLLTEK